MSWATDLIQRSRRLLTQPTSELSDAQRMARYSLELGNYSVRTLKQHRATQMAAALTYRTIFSLVPLLVLALMGVRFTGGFEHFGGKLQTQAYDYFGLSVLTDNGEPASEATIEMRERFDAIVNDLNQRMSEVSFGSIGAVGLAVLIWAALALVVTLEDCFNSVYGAPSGRPWHLRITIYWAAITLGPVLMLISLAVTSKVGDLLSKLPLIGPGVGFFDPVMALAASWIALFALYTLMPNAQVRKRPAMIGALAAAFLWEVGKWGFTLYVEKVVTYSTLYGSLSLIPLFMFWVYMNWLIVLFGLEVTYTLQTLPDFQKRKRQAEEERRLTGDPMWLIPFATAIGEAFADGQAAGRQETAEKLQLPLRVIDDLANLLESTGIIHKVTGRGNDVGYSLARPPEDVAVTELLDLVNMMQIGDEEDRQGAGWQYLNRLADAHRAAADNVTLKDVIRA